MKGLKNYINRIHEELNDSNWYIDAAIDLAAMGHREEAEIALNLAEEEYRHGTEYVHSIVTKLIECKRNEYTEKGMRIPSYMENLWTDEHIDIVDDASKTYARLETAKKSI